MASNVILCGVLIIITVDIPLQNSRMPLTDSEKVKAFLLAPSVYHDSRSMYDVAPSILEGGLQGDDTRSLRQAFFATDYTPPSPELSIPETVAAAANLELRMLEFREREACGLPLLGLCMMANLDAVVTSSELRMLEFREREACGLPLLGLLTLGAHAQRGLQ